MRITDDKDTQDLTGLARIFDKYEELALKRRTSI